jgi:oligopeptidase B
MTVMNEQKTGSFPRPPHARRVPLTHERFGVSWEDDWAWLRDPNYPKVEDPEILAYLAAENDYFEAVMAPHRRFVERLHEELKGRLKEDDSSVPVQDGAFEYRWSFAAGAQYRAWWRRKAGEESWRLVLDENVLAEQKSYFNLRQLVPGPDGRLIAYSSDEDGSERFGLVVRDLATGAELEHKVGNTSGAVVWAEDGRTLFYVELNENLRPFRVRAHELGGEQAMDRIVYEEDDPAFFVSIGKTRDGAFIAVSTGTHVTREIRVIPAGRPGDEPRLVAGRRDGHRYALDHAHGHFWITTNDRHVNFRLVRAPADAPDERNWAEIMPGDDHRYLLGASCFADFLVISERVDGLADLRIRHYGGEEHVIAFEEGVYTAVPGDNREFEADRVRVLYTSMITPPSVLDYIVSKRELVLRKMQEIPSGYDKSRYRTKRLSAPGRDGTAIPVTLVWRDDFPHDGSGALFMYGYGAYGHGNDPAFSPHRLSLLDRGFCFAMTHVRGGDELGWQWYEDGKLARKENSFEDFIATAEHLIATGWARAGRIAIRGGSAGGMLIGAVVNRRPELWRCALAEVPFVDVVNTMSDPSLPLTPIEWPEWGNPLEDPQALRRLLGYSPYDNIRAQAYPAMLVSAGISDPRVTYWEPAKYVARLRATKTDDNLLLFKTNMEAGHFGRSGRYEALLELAEHYAFVLSCFDLIADEE